ncbi:hypothetical protein PG989_000930 [Apiospora arundinis]
MDGPPPPPPPHGSNPRTTSSGGGAGGPNLPPGKYDIFIIPPHSSGSGFLYLPSMKPNVNSFAAGFASALVLVVLFQSMAPAFKTWWSNFQGMGQMGMMLLTIGVGVGAWVLGRTQNGASPGASFGGGAGSDWHSGPGAGSYTGAGAGPTPNGAPPPPPPHGNRSSSSQSGPHPGTHGGEKPNNSWQERPQAEEQQQQQEDDTKPEEPPEDPKPPPDGHKNAWEKAREETRRKEEERKAREAEEKKKEAIAKRLRELREKEARERKKREQAAKEKAEAEARVAREKAEAAAKAAKEKADAEAKIAREKAEAEAKAKAQREKEAKEKAEAEAKVAREKAEAEAKAKAQQEQKEKEEKERLQREKEQAIRDRVQREARLREARERELRERLLREKALREKLEKEAMEREAQRLQDEAARRIKEAVEQRKREAAEKEAKEATEKRIREEAERRVREAAEKEKQAKEAAEKLAKEAAEKKAKEEAESKAKAETVRKSTYAFSSVGEKTNPWPNGRPPSQPSSPAPSAPSAAPSSVKRPPPPTARTTEGDGSEYSFRPYDTPKQHNRRRSGETVFTESSYAYSQSTARTSPPPSERGAYSTKDPDKIVIKAVYSFMNQFAKTPASQLFSGQGTVTDGLILRITTEGLFIDDDVRGVPQREWDVKAWTLKLMEVWCSSKDFTVPAATPPAPKGKQRARMDRGLPKVLTGNEADTFLTNMLMTCKNDCRLCPHGDGASMHSRQSGEWKQQGLHVLRATIRDQDGKSYLFVLGEEEGWKVPLALQRLRRGTQVRQLGVQAMSVPEARNTLELLGWNQ